MQTQEFALYAKAGLINHVTIYRDRCEGGWEIWAYGDELPSNTRNPIDLARKRTRRTWASLDTAHDWVRRHGWTGDVGIDS